MDLNQKYEQLLAKISKKDPECEQTEIQNKRDDKLKALYDASLQFKNELA